MVRYEAPPLIAKCALPFFKGLRRPFKPKIIRLAISVLFWFFTFGFMIFCGNFATFRSPKVLSYHLHPSLSHQVYLFKRTQPHYQTSFFPFCLNAKYIHCQRCFFILYSLLLLLGWYPFLFTSLLRSYFPYSSSLSPPNSVRT
jgi:hypothetical protein